MKQTKTTWILVAHRSGAVVHESRGPGLPLTPAWQIENARGRLKPGELESDRPGRAFDRVGGGRHSMSSEENPAQRVANEFVLQLVQRLESARIAGSFERLVMIAPPRMVGALRDALTEPLRALLIASLPKDLAHSNGDDVRKHLIDVALV